MIDDAPGTDVRTRIVEAAAALLGDGGIDAVSTRAIAAAAGTKPPAIYRIFGDKSGLLDAVAEYGFARYLGEKTAPRSAPEDPIDELREGWDRHVLFGLDNPALFALMYGNPRAGQSSPAAAAAIHVLRTKVRRIAAAGLLTVSEDLAVSLLHAAGTGTVLTLLGVDEPDRTPGLSEANREMVISRITAGRRSAAPARSSPVTEANTLLARLGELTVLSDGERQLLAEWLRRIASEPAVSGENST